MVHDCEQGKYPVPNGARIEMERLEAHAASFTTTEGEQLMDLPDPGLITYRTDQAYRAGTRRPPFRRHGVEPSSPGSPRKSWPDDRLLPTPTRHSETHRTPQYVARSLATPNAGT